MMQESERGPDGRSGGEGGGSTGKRGGDRRGKERRRDDRRSPPPPWRRPEAYIAYGVLGALVLVLLVRAVSAPTGGDAREQAVALELAMEEPEVPQPTGPTREAYTLAQFERLVAEGEDAVGEVVRTELYCGSISPVTVRSGERPVHRRLLDLADTEGRVAGAECRWSRDGRTSDFLLIVPPDLAEEFATAPEVELNFVRRRRVPAELEWLGRSDALALRTAGVLKEIEM
jgi:hypothetical protein